jgi:hypothetical protein
VDAGYVGFVEAPNGAIAGVMVAVKVTDWLTVVVEEDALTVVVVPVALTVWLAVPELVAKFVSPLYVAVMV